MHINNIPIALSTLVENKVMDAIKLAKFNPDRIVLGEGGVTLSKHAMQAGKPIIIDRVFFAWGALLQ